jgi:hypothetical protein
MHFMSTLPASLKDSDSDASFNNSEEEEEEESSSNDNDSEDEEDSSKMDNTADLDKKPSHAVCLPDPNQYPILNSHIFNVHDNELHDTVVHEFLKFNGGEGISYRR